MRLFIFILLFLATSSAEPITPIPQTVEVNKSKSDLGKKLFFDTILSVDNTISCESCHENPLQTNLLSNNTILDLQKPKNIINGSPLTQKQLDKLHSKKYKLLRAKNLFE